MTPVVMSSVVMSPIDAVISWVDGYDPVYQEKLKTFCCEQGLDKNFAIEPTRINQHNEIHYCLHALRRFAPWIRTIYIVSNQQTPQTVIDLQGTDFGNKIKMIDQNELLHDAGVTSPVFNSLSIEWLIWQIKGLSNQFLYLNDDFFIIRDVRPHDFFRHNSSVLRGKWKTQLGQKWFYKIKKQIMSCIGIDLQTKTNPHRVWQETSARIAGWNKRFYLLPHAPFPLIKDTFEAYKTHNPQCVLDNIRYPFRHPDHLSSIPLMVHLDIKQKRVVFASDCQAVMVNGATHSLKKIKTRLNYARKNNQVAFVCMQSIDQAPSETKDYMMKWLQQWID